MGHGVAPREILARLEYIFPVAFMLPPLVSLYNSVIRSDLRLLRSFLQFGDLKIKYLFHMVVEIQ